MIKDDVKIFMKNISKFIVETCKQKEINIDELAIISGIKKGKIEDIINLKVDPPITILIGISNALQISLYELFSKNDPRS